MRLTFLFIGAALVAASRPALAQECDDSAYYAGTISYNPCEAPAACTPPTPATCLSDWYRSYDACYAEFRGYCDGVRREHTAQAAAQHPVKPALRPAGTSAPGTLTTVHATPYQGSRTLSGYTATNAGLAERSLSALRGGYGIADTIWWSSNGDQINSCREYVGEKYYEWTQVEEATDRLGVDYRAKAGQIVASAGLADGYVDSRNRWQRLEAWPNLTGPKNEFFTFKKPPAAPIYSGDGWSAQPTYAFGFYILNKISMGQSYGGLSFSGAHGVMQQAAALSDDELDRFDSLKARFADRTTQRNQAYDQWHRCLYAGSWDRANAICPAPFWNAPNTWLSRLNSAALSVSGHDFQLEQLLLEADAAGCLASSGPTACDITARSFVERIERRVKDAQQQDYKRCMKITSGSLSISDPPQNFVSKVKKDGLWSKHGYWLIYPGLAANTNPWYLDYVMNGAEAWVRELTSLPVNPATGRMWFGNAANDSSSFGSDKFGADFSYGFRWEVTDYFTDLRNAQLSASASAHANAYVLGHRVSVLDSAASARTSNVDDLEYHAHARVLGYNVFSPLDGKVKLRANIVETGKIERSLAGTSFWFTIGFIPIQISAGLAGAVGMDAGVSFNIQRPTAPARLEIRGHAGLHPWAQVSGFISAAVDLWLVKAGVKGELTIVRLDLPFSLDAALVGEGQSIGVNVGANLDLAISTMSGRLAAFLELLIPDKRWEIDLVSWDGLRDTTNLFHLELVNESFDRIRLAAQLGVLNQ